MYDLGIVTQIERILKETLSSWPLEWQGFTWPGYTYEHTWRVRNLSLSLAQQLGADRRIVELAALLHDIGKPAGEPHAEPSAQRAEAILAELGVDKESRQRICHIIGGHIDCDPTHPIENLVLYDADFIDANYGYIAFTRYITIRGHRGNPISDMVTEGQGWLSRLEERQAKVITPAGRSIARDRFERMRGFYRRLAEDLSKEKGDNGGPALDIARYLVADAQHPSLSRQIGEIEKMLNGGEPINGLRASPFLREFIALLKEEVAGNR